MQRNPTNAPWQLPPSTLSAPLAGGASVDVAVVGAGITGTLTALLCKRAGLRVALLDMAHVAAGETGRSTAHLTVLCDDGYRTLKSRFGRDGARAAAQAQAAGLVTLQRLVGEASIDCGWAQVPAYFYSESDSGVGAVREELQALHDVDIQAQWVDSLPLPFATRGGLCIEQQAQVDPVRLTTALARLVEGDGSAVYTPTRVLRVEPGEPCLVHTDAGVLQARDVVMATHAAINGLLLHTKVYAYRTYAMACTLACDDLPPPGLYYDTAAPYHYIRRIDAPDGPLLVVGGADHKTGQLDDTCAAFAALDGYIRERFAVRRVAHAWSGQVLEPADGLPLIGLQGNDPHIYVATGYSGNGLTLGATAAQLLTDLIVGQPNAWAPLFSPGRFKPLAQFKRYVRENVDVPLHLIGDRLQRMGSLDHLHPGDGGIVEVGDDSLAVYRDDQGVFHALSPVCPHMGCYVQWNTSEKTWDCPCHGSRFSCMGRLVNGPAVDDLPRMTIGDAERENEPPQAFLAAATELD